MMRRLAGWICTLVFLRLNHVKSSPGVRLEGRRRISFQSGAELGEKARIRARGATSQVTLGDGAVLREGVEINAKGGSVRIGADTFIARDVWLGGQGSIAIGKNSMIGLRTVLVSSDHDYLNVVRPYYGGSEVPKSIEIGDNVWVGAGCVILGGTRIGSGSVVGAGSVVIGEFPPDSLIVGVPAELERPIER